MHTGFTLAEALLTLVIIGTIAALTLPSIITNAEQTKIVTGLKKTHSTLQNAFGLAVETYGPVQYWGLDTPYSQAGAKNMLDKLSPFLNIEKNCGTGKGCFPNVKYQFQNGTYGNNIEDVTTSAKALLADGTSIGLYILSADCSMAVGTSEELKHACAIIDVDINGFKEPNEVGKDFFTFWITKDGFVPLGTPADTTYPVEACNTTGTPCAAWVILKGNTEYLGNEVRW